MNMFPFFIECSKYYQDEPHKQRFLQKLAFGHGIHIIKRKDKHILVTLNGEFVIPTIYSDKARLELINKLWKINDFTRLGNRIEDMRQVWQTTRKKDKIYLLYKYIASLSDINTPQKMVVSNILILALLLKMIKPTDIEYQDSKIVNVNENLLKKETYTQMTFTLDPPRTRMDMVTTCTIDEEEDD